MLLELCHVYKNEEALPRMAVKLTVGDLLVEKSYFKETRYMVLDFTQNNVKVAYGDNMLDLNVRKVLSRDNSLFCL